MTPFTYHLTPYIFYGVLTPIKINGA